METVGREDRTVLVVAGDGPEVDSLREGFQRAEPRVPIVRLDPDGDPDTVEYSLREAIEEHDVDAAVISDAIRTPVAVVELVTSETGVPVVLLAGGDAGWTVSRAIDADVLDVYPRVAAPGQYRVVADRLAGAAVPSGGDAGPVSGDGSDATGFGEERPYAEVFENVSDGLVVHDADTGEIRDVNEQYCELTGYSREELVGANIRVIVPEDPEYTFDEALQYIERARDEGPQLFEFKGERKDGTPFIGEVNLTTVALGGEEQVLASVRDITELKRSKQRFRTIAERVEEIIYLANADLTEVQYVNPAYEEVFGRSVEELYEDPRAFVEAVHPDDRADYRADVEAMVADIEAGDPDDSYAFSYRVVRPDGEVRWLEATGYPVRTGTADPHQFVGIATDVTDQHRRERTLETFHQATRELTAADSKEAACRQAVQAAQDVLGFPLVAAHLYDEETGVLQPTAVTDRLQARDAEPPAFGPGDSLAWQVYVDGDAARRTGASTQVFGPGVPDPDIVLPLGSHGVMLVGGGDGAADDGDIELAQILAATMEAALNHVAGERALEEREAALRREQERADRLEQLNAIIRDIEQATVEESSRAGIEDAVCERLVAADHHELVWVAEPSVGGDGLVPRTSAGGPPGYVDGLTGIVGSDGKPGAGHPALAAYRAGEPRVVSNVATEIAAGDWRSHALRHGMQSVVAVPIRYDTTTHGVLTVASADPDAFDAATEDVLAELGRSIGYAITVTEREQALESGGTTELEFSVTDEGLFVVRGSEAAGCRIRLERTIRRSGGSFSMFYGIDGAPPGDVVDLARTAPSVESAQVVTDDEGRDGGLIEVTAPTWFGSVFTEHGAVVREAHSRAGQGTLVVEAPHGTDVRGLVEGFQQRYPATDLEAQRQRDRTIRSLFELQDALRAELTDRQWEALETAYSAGYFGWPRETSGQEVAGLLGVSQPTFNKHLRIAEQSAFRMLLDREYPAEDASSPSSGG